MKFPNATLFFVADPFMDAINNLIVVPASEPRTMAVAEKRSITFV